jgi:hypothetical protein
MVRIWPRPDPGDKNLAMSILNDRLHKTESELRRLATGWYLNLQFDVASNTVVVHLTNDIWTFPSVSEPQSVRFNEDLYNFPSDKLKAQLMLIAK